MVVEHSCRSAKRYAAEFEHSKVAADRSRAKVERSNVIVERYSAKVERSNAAVERFRTKVVRSNFAAERSKARSECALSLPNESSNWAIALTFGFFATVSVDELHIANQVSTLAEFFC